MASSYHEAVHVQSISKSVLPLSPIPKRNHYFMLIFQNLNAGSNIVGRDTHPAAVVFSDPEVPGPSPPVFTLDLSWILHH